MTLVSNVKATNANIIQDTLFSLCQFCFQPHLFPRRVTAHNKVKPWLLAWYCLLLCFVTTEAIMQINHTPDPDHRGQNTTPNNGALDSVQCYNTMQTISSTLTKYVTQINAQLCPKIKLNPALWIYWSFNVKFLPDQIWSISVVFVFGNHDEN